MIIFLVIKLGSDSLDRWLIDWTCSVDYVACGKLNVILTHNVDYNRIKRNIDKNMIIVEKASR